MEKARCSQVQEDPQKRAAGAGLFSYLRNTELTEKGFLARLSVDTVTLFAGHALPPHVPSPPTPPPPPRTTGWPCRASPRHSAWMGRHFLPKISRQMTSWHAPTHPLRPGELSDAWKKQEVL